MKKFQNAVRCTSSWRESVTQLRMYGLRSARLCLRLKLARLSRSSLLRCLRISKTCFVSWSIRPTIKKTSVSSYYSRYLSKTSFPTFKSSILPPKAQFFFRITREDRPYSQQVSKKVVREMSCTIYWERKSRGCKRKSMINRIPLSSWRSWVIATRKLIDKSAMKLTS